MHCDFCDKLDECEANNRIATCWRFKSFKSDTFTDYSIIRTHKSPTIEEQIAELHKQVEELKQEVTVLKTLLPPAMYKYSFSNTNEQ